MVRTQAFMNTEGEVNKEKLEEALDKTMKQAKMIQFNRDIIIDGIITNMLINKNPYTK